MKQILEPIEEFPNGMLADFICIVRDSIAAYISYFPREIYHKVLKWANHVYDTRANSRQIDSRAYINLLHLCMFLRYDDVREEASMNIINKLIIEWTKHNNTKDLHSRLSPLMSPLKSAKSKPNTYDAMRGIVIGLVHHVQTVKITEDDITKFLNSRVVDDEFDEWIAEWMNRLYAGNTDTYYDELMSCTMIILAKICSQELPLRLTAKSETIKRRIHGMKLLSVFLSKSSHNFNDKNGVMATYDESSAKTTISLILLRRVVFTSFVHNAITPIPALFKKMLSIFKILWTSYRINLKFEIGVLLDIGIIGLLQSKYCTAPQKIDLLRGLLEIFQNRGALINIFYNYDNDIDHWPICAKLVTTLSKLTENGINDNAEDNSVIQHSLLLLSRFMQLIAKYLKAQNLSSGGNIDEQENFDSLGGGLEAMLDYMNSNKPTTGPSSNALLSLYSGISGVSGSNPNMYDSASNGQQTLNNSVVLNINQVTSSAENSQKQRPSIHDDVASISSFGSNKVITLPTVKETSRASKSGKSRVSSNHDTDLEEKHVDHPSSTGRRHENNQRERPMPVGTEEKKEFDEDVEEEEIKFNVATQPSIFLDDKPSGSTIWNDQEPSPADGYVLRVASMNDQFGSRGSFGRRSSAVSRHDQHQEEQMIISKALKKARSEKLKTAIKFLVSHQHTDAYKKFSTLSYIAEFLYTNETLNKEQIGEFIGSLDTKGLFSEGQHAQLLMLYVSQLNFTGLSFDTAFRHFLTDSGFRLPKEGQKIDRLLIAFSQIFTKHNPQYFDGNHDCALFLAYGMLMLNTELHDQRLQDTGNTPMTKQQFYKVVQSGDHKLDKKLLCEIYDSVKDNEIQMETPELYDGNNSGKSNNTKSNTNKSSQFQTSLYKQQQFRKECATLVNKSLAKLRDSAMKKHRWQKARQRDIVKTLYSVTWHQFLGSITTILQQTHDPSTQSICLDAIKYSCAAAICLRLNDVELHAFLCDLAKFVFDEQNKHLIPQSRRRAILEGEHLKQEWFTNIMNFAKTGNIKVGCEVVSHVCNDMKAKVLYDANQKMLRDIEQELGGSLYLVHPDRKFIYSGPLTKQSTKGDLDCYRFYLFNDLLIYVSGNIGNYTVHRVLHLSLCQIKDLRDGFVRNIKNAFRVISPQKNIILIAETSKEKHEWFQLIDNAISKQIEQRERWINENYQSLQEYHKTAQVSKYLGRESKPKKHELHRVQNGKTIKNSKELNADVLYEIKVFFDRSNPCKLCAKPFKRFTRKSKCPWCLDIICKDCIRKKTSLPEKSKNKSSNLIKVCDGCYGAISYYVHDIVNPHTYDTTIQTHDYSSMRR